MRGIADSAGAKAELHVVAAPAIEKRIFVIRERQVMLDEDLVDLYGVETKRLIEQVKRNFERFPEDFMFQLRKDEAAALRSQIATSNDLSAELVNRISLWLSAMPSEKFTLSGVARLAALRPGSDDLDAAAGWKDRFEFDAHRVKQAERVLRGGVRGLGGQHAADARCIEAGAIREVPLGELLRLAC
jgi:hypothetical protein